MLNRWTSPVVPIGPWTAKIASAMPFPSVSMAATFTGALLLDPVNESGIAPNSPRLAVAVFQLHTSIREGWGLNVLEANALGTPAVVYPVDGLVDATLHDDTGIVTREETPESMAEALADLLKQPGKYERFRQRACDRTREFHWSRILPPACDWLEKLASKPACAG